jgi:tellurite resistance protein
VTSRTDQSALPQLAERLSPLRLFAGLKGRGADDRMDVATAVMIPMVAAMMADGRNEDEELSQIEGICAFSPIYDRYSPTEIGALIVRSVKQVEDSGFADACQKVGQFLSPALRETAFVFAVRVVFSDGYVGRLEREIMERMIQWLQLDSERARTLVDVVSVMHHPATA